MNRVSDLSWGRRWGRWTALLRRAVLLVAAASLLAPGCRRLLTERTLVVGLDNVPITLDPHHHNDNVTWSLLSNFYDGLVRFSDEMKLQPSLASSWRQLDPTHLEFTLRPGVRFADGQPLRAADVVASFERARSDPRSGIHYYLLGIRAFTAPDDGRVVVETDAPSPTLLNRLVFLFIVPKSEATKPEISSLNGTGPYRPEEIVPGSSLTAVGWNSFRGVPDIRRVTFRFSEDVGELARSFLANKIDVFRHLPEELVAALPPNAGFRAEPQPQLVVYNIAVNARATTGEARRALSDPRVRRALLESFDRQRLVREALRGAGAVASQYVHPVVFGFDPGIQPVPYDPADARSLLAQAGFAHGFEVTFDYRLEQEDIVRLLAADAAKVGIRLKLSPATWPDLVRRATAGETPFMLWGWACTTGDASDFLNACIHSRSPDGGLGYKNYSEFADPEVDALIEKADHEIDPALRLRLLQQAQRQTLRSLPVLPLMLRFQYVGVSGRVAIVTRLDQWQWVASYRWVK